MAEPLIGALYDQPIGILGLPMDPAQPYGVLGPGTQLSPAHAFIRDLFLRQFNDRHRQGILRSIDGTIVPRTGTPRPPTPAYATSRRG
jgi:hypothetical protein